MKLPVPFIIRIAEWRCRCVGYGNNFLFHTRLEFTHKSTVVWTFAGKLNQKRIQYDSLDLIRIVGTTLSAYLYPDYPGTTFGQNWDFYPDLSPTSAQIRDFYPDFQMTSKGILGGPIRRFLGRV